MPIFNYKINIMVTINMPLINQSQLNNLLFTHVKILTAIDIIKSELNRIKESDMRLLIIAIIRFATADNPVTQSSTFLLKPN